MRHHDVMRCRRRRNVETIAATAAFDVDREPAARTENKTTMAAVRTMTGAELRYRNAVELSEGRRQKRLQQKTFLPEIICRMGARHFSAAAHVVLDRFCVETIARATAAARHQHR